MYPFFLSFFCFLICSQWWFCTLTPDWQYEGKVTKIIPSTSWHPWLVHFPFIVFRALLKFYSFSLIIPFITINFQLCLFLLWSFLIIYPVNHRTMVFLCVKLPFHYLCPGGLLPSHLLWFHSKVWAVFGYSAIESVWALKNVFFQ